MKRIFTASTAAVALALCAAPFAVIGTSDASAATMFTGQSITEFVLQASPALLALKADVQRLEERAAQLIKTVEGENATAEEVRQAEQDHAALLDEIRAKRAAIEQTEAALSTGNEPPAEVTVEQQIQRTIRAERERAAEIRRIGQRAGMTDEQIQTAIDQDMSLEAFRTSAFDHMADEATGRSISSVPRVSVTQDEGDTRRQAAVNALLHRAAPGVHELRPEGREFRGMSLIDLARDSLERAGLRTRGLSRSEVAARAFHSTSDFPHILENVASRSLRDAYDAAPRTFLPFCREITASDFKAQHRVQLGEAPKLEKVNESGEFKRGSIKESKESIKVDTYGKVVGITRQVIINDDLGAFTRIPAMFGTAIATLENDIVWGVFLSGVLSDGKPIFHADHKNLVASGVALSVDGIAATRVLMRKQRGLDGKTHLSITPRYLIVPSDLETRAEQILNTIVVPEKAENGVPISLRSLTPVVEPRLDSAPNAYYLAADPSAVDTIEYAYLEGQRGAYVETRQGFDVDGMEVKCRLDFGAAAIDFRGFAKNPGAAPQG